MTRWAPWGHRQGKCEVRIHRGGKRPVTENARARAQQFLDFAYLSALVYREFNVPAPMGWSQSPDPLDTMDDAKTSLYFEVWEKLGGNPVDVAVVFRGTHELKDWWSNARWITRFIPTGWDQYTLTRREIGNVVARARGRHANARMITSGHSLGGGLAQQAAYAHPDTKLVVAFDPSPVAGFRSVPEPARTQNQRGIEIFRVYERGEILAYLRQFVRRAVPLSEANPSITEVRFDLSQGDPVRQHSMIDLANDMAWAASNC